MNKNSSKDMMEREFDILQSIQGLEPPADLYNKILAKTAEQGLTVSKKWFAGAAAMIAILVCLEIFLITKSYNNTSPTNELETVVQKENYHLYE